MTLQYLVSVDHLRIPEVGLFEALGAYVESLTCVAAPSQLRVVLEGAQHLCVQ